MKTMILLASLFALAACTTPVYVTDDNVALQYDVLTTSPADVDADAQKLCGSKAASLIRDVPMNWTGELHTRSYRCG